ncbi:HAD family hydrolase [Streptomyces sp. NPDC086023]|uniref:HAD family hydrolase n=1 Tax=Streptomyces sp. NPDC086023 TaxID=3365746 RepID=UPI0037D8CB7D
MRYLATMSSSCESLSSQLSAAVTGQTGAAPHRSDNSQAADRPEALVLDLFGTLVAAPDIAERSVAVAELASALGVTAGAVEAELSASWRVRHDGELRSAAAVAGHLVERCSASADRTARAASVLRRLATARLRPDESVCRALAELQRSGLRLALLSDASPDIAECWSESALASYFEVAAFSCWEGAVKPAPRLYGGLLARLGVAPAKAVYCGDGGGDELAGAQRLGMRPLRVLRRGGAHRLAFGETPWSGASLPSVEALPVALASGWSV